MGLKNSPCKGCTERTEYGACHSTCDKYLAYRKEIDENQKARSSEMEFYSAMRNSHKRRTAAFTKLNKRSGKYIPDNTDLKK